MLCLFKKGNNTKGGASERSYATRDCKLLYLLDHHTAHTIDAEKYIIYKLLASKISTLLVSVGVELLLLDGLE